MVNIYFPLITRLKPGLGEGQEHFLHVEILINQFEELNYRRIVLHIGSQHISPFFVRLTVVLEAYDNHYIITNFTINITLLTWFLYYMTL